MSSSFFKLVLLIGGMSFLQNYFSQEQRTPFLYFEGNKIVKIDTSSLENFHNYRINNEYLWLGNNGLASFPLVYNPNINFSVSRFLPYKVLTQREYNVYVPFTSVKYVQGARQEQYFEITHTQNFQKQGNFSLGYKKINSLGSYNWQKTNNNNLFSNIWWKTKNENYRISFFANRIKNTGNQNGGLVNDSLFIIDSSFTSNRKTLAVNLTKAKDIRIYNQLQVNQEVKLSSSLDSLKHGNEQLVLFKSVFKNSKRTYFDTLLNVEYYQNILLDSNVTNDKIIINQLSQEVAYLITNRKAFSEVKFSPFVNYTYLDYKQNKKGEYYHNVSVGTNIKLKNKKLFFSSNTAYFLLGYQKNNIKTVSNFNIKINKNFTWFFNPTLTYFSPSIDVLRYRGNHNSWNNSFDKIRLVNFSTGTNLNKLGIEFKFSYTDIYKPIYFNYLQEAKQYNGYSQIIQTSLAKKIKLGKWRIEPKAIYQYSGGFDIYRLPDYLATLKIAYKFKAFKNKLALYAGTKITYYGAAELKSYSTSLGQFYLSPNPQTGNYPFVSLFVSGRIKSVRLFFALTHVNSGLTGNNNYFGAKNYPLEDRAYKVGVNWNFLK